MQVHPRLSVVVVPLQGAPLERCLESLRTQADCSVVEVLIVADKRSSGTHEAARREFQEFRWIATAPGATVPQKRLVGIQHSRGDVVAFIEGDCVASETWCATVIRAHEEPAAAVGGAVVPGPYRTLVDWAAYFTEYVRFMPPLPRGPAQQLPGTNVSYKRAVLDVERLLPGEANGRGAGLYEVFLHAALRSAGHQLWIDPACVVVHEGGSWTLRRLLAARFHHGRGFAALRSGGRPLLKRWRFLIVAIILPALQAARSAAQVVKRRRHVRRFIMALPLVLLCALSWSAGELLGYLVGPGISLEQWR